ncbi:MAG TPA: hypothetical protein VK728_17845 [Candidatus Sulfotelmatobacter sp.]|nr:hypothetical protein [Candidatus Sulfotelmatobacter sp.]
MTTKHTEPTDTRCQLRFADGRRCALPAHPQGEGLCYPHAHAPHRRLRPSDLTRELIAPRGTLVPSHKIRRVLAKLPVAVAEGLFSPAEAGLLTHLCNLMLGCNRQARANPRLKPTATDQKFLSSLFTENDAELSHPPANR